MKSWTVKPKKEEDYSLPQGSDLSKEKLIQGINEDIASAQQTSLSSQAGRGNVAPTHDYALAPKALRIKGKMVAQKELGDVQNAMNDAIKYIMDTSEFKNQQERLAAETDLRKKMNKFQLDALKRGAAFEARMSKMISDEEEASKTIGMIGDTIRNAAAIAIGNRKKDKANPLMDNNTSTTDLTGDYMGGNFGPSKGMIG